MKKTSRLLLVIALLTLILGACSRDNAGDAGNQEETRVVLITTEKVKVLDIPIWQETVGRIHSVSVPTLAAEVEGRITMVSADTGDRIEVGHLLAETDTSTLLLKKQAAKASLERLEVHIANGERRVDRYKTLSAKDLSSQTQLDDASEQLDAFRADYKAAIAQLAIVNDSLEKSRVLAPVSGVIQQRFIAEGDFVKRGQALFEITQPENLQAWLPYPESMALKVRIGQPAKIYSPLTPGEFVSATVSELQPSIGLGSRAIMAIVDLENPGQLRPDATLSGKVLIETHENATLVPNISVVRRPAGEVVYIINGNTAEARLVQTGYQEDGMIEIVTGLEGHETIAAEGAAFLTDGALIKVAGQDS